MKIVNEEEARKSILEEEKKGNNSAFFKNSPKSKKSPRKTKRGSFIKNIFVDIKDLFLLVKDYLKGNYREVPLWVIIAIAIALIYIINPLDFVPDVIPILGLLDDALVLSICLSLVGIDLKKYRKWKSQQ